MKQNQSLSQHVVQPPSFSSVRPFNPSTCLASFSSLLKELKPISVNTDHSVSTIVNQLYPVPFSKWIPVKPFLEKEIFYTNIPIASVVTPSRQSDLNSKQSSKEVPPTVDESPRYVTNDV